MATINEGGDMKGQVDSLKGELADHLARIASLEALVSSLDTRVAAHELAYP